MRCKYLSSCDLKQASQPWRCSNSKLKSIVAFSDVSDHFQTVGKMQNGLVGSASILGGGQKGCWLRWHFLQFSRSVRRTPPICQKCHHNTCSFSQSLWFLQLDCTFEIWQISGIYLLYQIHFRSPACIAVSDSVFVGLNQNDSESDGNAGYSSSVAPRMPRSSR